MRNHFVALEAENPPVVENCVSMEEEAILTQEAGEAAAGAESDLAEAERVAEISDALEDLACIGDSIETASPAEAALIDNAAQMAVAGSDTAPEEVVPAMESFVGKKIATESIRERARAIWESIQRFLANIWEKIKKFFYNVFSTLPNLRRNVEAMKKRVEAIEGKTATEKKITVSTGVAALSVAYVPVKTHSELKSALGVFSNQIDVIFDKYMDRVAKLGKDLAHHIENFDPEKAEESTKKLSSEFSYIDDLIKGSGGDDKRYPGFKAFASPAILGNVQLVRKVYLKDSEDVSPLGILDKQRKSGLTLESVTGKKQVPNDFQMDTLSASDMIDILDSSLETIKTLEEYKRGSRSKEIEKTQATLKSASDKATKAMEKAEGNKEDPVGQAAVPHYRAMLNFNMAYAGWVRSPAIPCYNLTVNLINALLHVCSKSIAQYKDAA